jgi:DNA topoisomerase-1
MKEYSPTIISSEMTRVIERNLQEIENGTREKDEVLESSVDEILTFLGRIRTFELEIGKLLQLAVIKTLNKQNLIGSCPLCKEGNLMIIKSKKTGKRFIGCTNYNKGLCKASSPLPQNGSIRASDKYCTTCGWPIIYVRNKRIPWRLCVNIKCPKKEDRKKLDMQTVSKSSR